jgi:hypothetical protein
MVSKVYLLEKPPPPSRAKRFMDQRVVPLLIDAAGAVEGRLEELAVTARRAPLCSFGLAVAMGFVLKKLVEGAGAKR